MFNSNKIHQLIDWLKDFKSQHVMNEPEVETKFVIPLFQKLGYSDNFYRAQYTIKTYKPDTSGRVDRVYFSVDDPEQQNRQTSLVIIEAKEPRITNLDEAILQAEYYETYFKPVFLVATNGCTIKVFKIKRYAEKEVVFDQTVDDLLSDFDTAKRFYEQFNFEVVSKIKKEYQESELPHEKYILLEKSLRNYPELQSVLAQGEFEPDVQVSEDKIKIIKPKVSVECKLPLFLKEGKCEIKFSNILRRGLQIQVSHRDILGKFMIGLGTSPDWGTRSFIFKINENAFRVKLGETSTTLSRVEVEDLCECIDEVCKRYKDIILGIQAALEAEEYEFVEIPTHCTSGFRLLSVQQWLWELMKRFSEEHCRDTYNESEWHIFESNTRAIRVESGCNTHAMLYPVHCDSDYSNGLLSGYVNVVYEIQHISISRYSASWQQNVGKKGIWTVEYTRNWLLNELIPKVENYYDEEFQRYYYQFCENEKRSYHSPFTSYETHISNKLPLEEVSEPKDLEPYLRDVQEWMLIHGNNLDASILRPYYHSFVELCRNSNLPTVSERSFFSINYLIEKLYTIEMRLTEQEYDRDYYDSLKSLGKNYILNAWTQHARRINEIEYEPAFYADLISRTFIAVVENCEINYQQSHLNAAKLALIPLWQQSQFEKRYVFPNRSR